MAVVQAVGVIDTSDVCMCYRVYAAKLRNFSSLIHWTLLRKANDCRNEDFLEKGLGHDIIRYATKNQIADRYTWLQVLLKIAVIYVMMSYYGNDIKRDRIENNNIMVDVDILIWDVFIYTCCLSNILSLLHESWHHSMVKSFFSLFFIPAINEILYSRIFCIF